MALKVENKIDLSFSEFLGLVQEHKLSINENSPLYILNKIAQPQSDLSHLKKDGLLDSSSDWYDAFVAICNPDFITNNDLLFTDSTISSSHLSNRSNSKLIVGCWPLDNNSLRISFPWSPMDILSNSLSAIVVDKCGSLSNIEELSFSADGFIAFCAAVDAVRTILFASTLQREQIPLFELPIENLNEMLQSSIKDESRDNRWLLSLISSYASDFVELSNEKVSNEGLNELLDYKLIKITTDNYWSPSPLLLDIASNWLMPLPALHHEIVVINTDSRIKKLHNIALRGSGPLSLIEFKTNDDEKQIITLCSITKDDYWLHIMGQLTPPEAENKPNIALEPEIDLESKNDKQVKPTKVFSEDLIYRCPSCNAIVEKGQKFCTSCGYKLPENLEPVQKKEIVKKCPVCGAELEPGAKFCTKCGAKV